MKCKGSFQTNGHCITVLVALRILALSEYYVTVAFLNLGTFFALD